MTQPKIFSIAAGIPFLPTLVHSLLQGQLIKDLDLNDPLALADVTLYVPTQRAAQSLRAVFLELNPQKTTIFPVILPLGASLEIVDMPMNGQDPASSLLFPNLIPDESESKNLMTDTERSLLLARLIRSWREKLPKHIQLFFTKKEMILPTNSADAIWLARDLAQLLDDMETEEASWSALMHLAPEELAQWWQITHEFLTIITKNWPEILQERNAMSAAAWRNNKIRRQAQYFAEYAPTKPVIIAGSTGSLPATAELMKTIAFLPKGAVVLPGLDRDLDETSWSLLSEPHRDKAIFGHPQYGLSKLLHNIGASRSTIVHLGTDSSVKRQRETWLSHAFRPASTTHNWHHLIQNHEKEMEAAFQNIDLIEAQNEQEEALAIAIALRCAVEEGKKAALITNDRTLVRYVSAQLQRFGLQAEDSGGIPLAETPAATLIRLLLMAVFTGDDPTIFLSLLQHPLVFLEQPRDLLQKKIGQLELFALRGTRGSISLANCDHSIATILEQKAELINKLDADLFQDLCHLGTSIVKAAAPLQQFSLITRPVTISEAIAATRASLENFARDEHGNIAHLYGNKCQDSAAHQAENTLSEFLQSLASSQSDFTFPVREWPNIFSALIADQTLNSPRHGYPGLFIWGTFEARLQDVDRLILSSLNEGSLPKVVKHNPFMSRMMKMAIGLEPPERRIGLAAHDFQMALGKDHCLLTRSLRQNNTPSTASRWLQRLETVLGKEIMTAMRQRGSLYLRWAEQLDNHSVLDTIERPNPKPPLSARPKHFSVTEIELLRRDPYAIYAKKILQLRPLEALMGDPSHRERGILYHNILHLMTQNKIMAAPEKALAHLLEIAHTEFHKAQLPPHIQIMWWPQFCLLAPQLIQWEREYRPDFRFSEITAQKTLINETGIYLSGRADRIDVTDSYAAILDFKTSMQPTVKQATALLAPQLALEGALLSRGAFLACGAHQPKYLRYIRLIPKGEVLSQDIPATDHKTASDLSEEAWQKLDDLMRFYHNIDHGYLSRTLPPTVHYEGDYDHLARIWEWLSEIGD